MTGKNNKGFSLVEVLIAVAVMALLISPIIMQTLTSLNTNKRAKERQQVIDNADMIMEYFKSTPVKDLAVGDIGKGVKIKSISSPAEITCKAVYFDSSSTPKDVKYTVTDYTIEEARFGRQDKKIDETDAQKAIAGIGNIYTRTVSLDDLNNKLLKNGCRLKYYDNKQDAEAAVEELKNAGSSVSWEVTSEFSVVAYDNKNHVVSAVVEPRDAVIDPNEIDLGNIQDLDNSKIAIIEGNATTLDKQFQDDFIASLATLVAAHKDDLIENNNWSGKYDTTNNISKTFDSIRSNSSEFSRYIYISVKAEVSGTDVDCYRVKAEVKYRVSHSFLNQYNSGNNYIYNKSYTIFDQKFNTTESPDVFFVYEPFITSMSAKYASYAFNDYIIVDSDPYTSVTNPSKIYLVKPDKTWAQVSQGGTIARGIDLTTSETEEDKIIQDLKNNNTNFNYYLTKMYSTSEEETEEGTSTVEDTFIPVNIDLSYIESNDGSKPLQIISNISTTKDASGVYSVINNPINGKKQFSYNLATSYSDFPGLRDGILQSGENLSAYPEEIQYSSTDKVKSLSAPVNDTRKSGRLYSITVTFHNTQRATEANVYTYFTGAKGAD